MPSFSEGYRREYDFFSTPMAFDDNPIAFEMLDRKIRSLGSD
jgi:hypothetical protein